MIFRKKKQIALLTIVIIAQSFTTGCDPQKIVNGYFKKAGLNRLAAARTDIEPGGLILSGKDGALYVDNMLDYLPPNPKNEYSIVVANEMAQYQAVLKKYEGDKSMDAKAALGFIQTFLPLSLDQTLKLNGNVKIDLVNAQVKRMKIPTVITFLNSADSQAFRQAALSFMSDKETSAYLVYEVWRTNKLKITTESGSDISTEIKVGEVMPINLGSGEGKFSYKRTSKSEILIDGDTYYAFAVRTAKLVPGTAAALTLLPMKFVPPKDEGIKGGDPKDDISFSAAVGKDFEPIQISRP